MTVPTTPSADLATAVAGAYGAAAGMTILVDGRHRVGQVPPVGTEHLLLGALGRHRAVDQALGRLGITPTIVLAVVQRSNDDGWAHDDRGGAIWDPRLDQLIAALTRRKRRFGRARRSAPIMSFTTAAQRALHRALVEAERGSTPQVRSEHLLVALLADPTSRAAEALVALGVDRELAYRSAISAAEAPAPAPATEEVDIDLRLTRAVLLGRASYTPGTATHRTLLSLLRTMHVNWAEMPELWAVLDARAHARRLGTASVGSDHLLLGILATHEVAHAHPQMLPADAERRYVGGAVLAAHGATYGRVKGAMVAADGVTSRRGGLADADVDALRAIGVDADAILSNVERSFGPGAMSDRASVRRTRLSVDVRLGWRAAVDGAIDDGGTGRMLAAILGIDGAAASRLLVMAGVDPDPVRQRLAAAGSGSPP